MKRNIFIIGFAALLLLSFQTNAQAAKAGSIDGNQYFCVGVMIGMVSGYVPVLRPIMDKFSFGPIFFVGGMAMEGLNDASGLYSIEGDDLGFERINATCTAVDYEKGLYLNYDIKAVNIIDVGIVGTITLTGEKDFEDAGTAIGFFFGVRNLLD